MPEPNDVKLEAAAGREKAARELRQIARVGDLGEYIAENHIHSTMLNRWSTSVARTLLSDPAVIKAVREVCAALAEGLEADARRIAEEYLARKL